MTPGTIQSMEFSRPEYWRGQPFPSPGDLPRGSNPSLPHFRRILLPVEPQGKPKNTGVSSLSLPQWIFPTQELNQGLLHCRQILHHLSYQGSPKPQGSTERNAVTTCHVYLWSALWLSSASDRCRGTLLTPCQLLQYF